MKFLKALSSIFLKILIVVVIISLIATITISSTILNPRFPIRMIAHIDFSSISQSMLTRISDGGEFEPIIADLLETREVNQVLQKYISASFYSLYGFIIDGHDKFSFKFNIKEFQNELRIAMINAVNKKYGNHLGSKNDMIINFINQNWKTVTDNVVNRFELTEQDIFPVIHENDITTIRTIVRGIQYAVPIQIILLIALSALLFLFKGSLKQKLQRIGLMLFIPAMCILLLVIISPVVTDNLLNNINQNFTFSIGIYTYYLITSDIVLSVVSTVLSGIVDNMALSSGVLSTIGVVFFGLSYVPALVKNYIDQRKLLKEDKQTGN